MDAQYHTPAEVGRIAELDTPVLRNVQITQSYFELSAALARRFGSGANWCTFATWASKQAGQTMRKEDLSRALEQAMTDTPAAREAAAELTALIRLKDPKKDATAVRKLIWEALNPGAAMERASDAVGRGNQKVYAEIGRAFAGFIESCADDPAPDPDKIARFCDTLRDGDPPDGQRYLRRAFTHYYQALFAAEPKARAEWLLLANLEIGFHEQTRLQPEIAEALEASVIDPNQFTRRLLSALFPHSSWIVYAGLLLMRLVGSRTQLDLVSERFFTEIRHRIRRFLTDHLMVLCFPKGQRLRLGEDLQAAFPENLRHLANPELLALLQQIDPTPDSLHNTGAVDWADLKERIHFIADMFRCYHESADLLEPPFSAEQVAEMKAGNVPAGEL